MEDKYNLKRFIEVQERDYKTALLEIKNGYKRSHWMWYIFPQLSSISIFSDIINKFYDGKKDEKTLELLKKNENIGKLG